MRKSLALAITVMIGVVFFIGCEGDPRSNITNNGKTIHQIALQTDYDNYIGYNVDISGTIKDFDIITSDNGDYYSLLVELDAGDVGDNEAIILTIDSSKINDEIAKENTIKASAIIYGYEKPSTKNNPMAEIESYTTHNSQAFFEEMYKLLSNPADNVGEEIAVSCIITKVEEGDDIKKFTAYIDTTEYTGEKYNKPVCFDGTIESDVFGFSGIKEHTKKTISGIIESTETLGSGEVIAVVDVDLSF